MNLDGAGILISGGSLGIGKAAAKLLVENGAQVAITGRDANRIHAAAEQTGALAIVADVGRPEDIKRTYSEFFDNFERLDCLVNNAGIGMSRRLEDVTFEDFETLFRINVYGVALMAAEAARVFVKQNCGNIINIGSTAGLKGYERATIYAGSKFALRGMTQCWQAELRKHNVRVFLINPSEVATAIGSSKRVERTAAPNKLRPIEIAYAIKSILEMDDRGFVPEHSVWATNPW
jgi:3-oxoacyl-[acyl-carrier protein] reductase